MDNSLIAGMPEVIAYIKKIEEENKRLDETLEDTLASLNFFQEQCSELKNERKELKHKMEELKGDSEKLDDALIRAAVATKTYDDFVGDLKVIDEENKELKEENKRLKEKDKGWTQLMKGSMDSGLVGKVERLEEDLLYYRMYVYSIDPGADCSPEKEHVDSFTDDPEKRKTLYERIGYESDDEE